MAPLVRTGGSRHTGLAAPPHRNIQCSREVIERGANQLGWELEKLLTMTLQAMAASEDTIRSETEEIV